LIAPIDSWRKAPADAIQCYMGLTEPFSLTIVCNGHGVDPFAPEFLPDYFTSIDYNFDLRFVFQDYGHLGCVVEVQHQGFPDYEAHVSGMTLWERDHGGYTAEALGGSLEVASPPFNFVQLF
jgi:hypothetical protein